MPYDVTIDDKRRLVASTWHGHLDEAQCKTYIDNVWGEGAVSDYDELLDFRKVSSIDLSADAIAGLVARSRSVANPAAKARSVLVASEDLVFGLSRMYVSMRDMDDHHQREWKVTDNYDEARAWLDAHGVCDC